MEENINIHLMNQIRSTENIIKRVRQLDTSGGTGYGRILHALYDNDGITQSQLADMLDIRPQSLTRALSELEEKEFIKRIRDKEDRRRITVSLTEKGIQHHDFMRQRRQKRAEIVFECLSEEQKKQLNELLNLVINSYTEKEKEQKND